MDNLKGKTALVTGASSGLGVSFAKLLAARGCDLVITARREENMKKLAEEIRAAHKVKVSVIALDLSEPTAPAKLFEKTEGAGQRIDILINNAGGGIHSNFTDIAWDRVQRQIQLNVVSLTELTHLFTKVMLARDEGWVLNVASIGGYLPTPTYATYAAGKAFVRDFSEAIAYELRDTNVRVCCLCPGGTTTEFHQASGHELPKAFKAVFMSADSCAEIGLNALFAGRRNIVSGLLNAISMWSLRFMPRRLMVWFGAKSMGEPKKLDAGEPTKSAPKTEKKAAEHDDDASPPRAAQKEKVGEKEKDKRPTENEARD